MKIFNYTGTGEKRGRSGRWGGGGGGRRSKEERGRRGGGRGRWDLRWRGHWRSKSLCRQKDHTLGMNSLNFKGNGKHLC